MNLHFFPLEAVSHKSLDLADEKKIKFMWKLSQWFRHVSIPKTLITTHFQFKTGAKMFEDAYVTMPYRFLIIPFP